MSRALVFDGTGEVDFTEQLDGIQTALYAASNFTAEVWVKPDAAMTSEGTYALLRRTTIPSGANNYLLALKVADNGALTAFGGFDRQDAGHIAFTVDTGNAEIPRDEWTHLALSFSQEERRLILYVNGVEQVRGAATGAEPVAADAGRVYLGSTGFKGLLKEARIWNTERTAGEIFQDYRKALVFTAYQLENVFYNNVSYVGRRRSPLKTAITTSIGRRGFIRMSTIHCLMFMDGKRISSRSKRGCAWTSALRGARCLNAKFSSMEPTCAIPKRW